MSILIKNVAYLLPDCSSWGRGDILLEGNIIAGIGNPTREMDANETIDASGKLALPGFINAHAHSYTSYLKGSVDCMPLDIYMLYAITGGSFRTPREIYVCTLISALEMLKSGTTCVVDHFSQRPVLTPEGIEAAASAYEKIGMRANLALMFADLDFLDTLPADETELPERGGARRAAQSPEEFASVAEEAYRDCSGKNGLVRVMLGTDGPQRCSDKLLQITGELERKCAMGWQTHALESKTQAVFSKQKYGCGLIEHLNEMSLLNGRLSLVHAVWLSEREIGLCAENGVSVVHCPGSNLHLGSGLAPLGMYRDCGVNIAIGSDGVNCGGASMPEQLRLAARLSRISELDYERWITASDVLHMAYTGGAGAALRDDIGRLEVGARADLFLVDKCSPIWQPGGNLSRSLVYNWNGGGVDTVFVDGRKVIENGRSLFVDEGELYAEAEEIYERLSSSLAPRFAEAGVQAERLRCMYMRVMSEPWEVNRLGY